MFDEDLHQGPLNVFFDAMELVEPANDRGRRIALVTSEMDRPDPQVHTASERSVHRSNRFAERSAWP